jgi:MFS family permease
MGLQDTPTRPLRQTLGMVTLSWVFGSVWHTTVTGAPLTQFAADLGASPWQFGLLTAMPFLASLLSLPASMLIEHTGARKPIFFAGLYFQRTLWFVIALLPLWIVSRNGLAGAPVTWFLGLTFLMHAGQAVGGPAWVSWMADVVPGRVRGRFFSRRRQFGILPAIPAALLVGWVMDRSAGGGGGGMSSLQACALIFMAAACFGLVDIHAFHAVPDAKRPTEGHKDVGGLCRAMTKPLCDRQFLIFGAFTAMMTFSLCFMTQFVSLYLIKQLRVTSLQVQLMLVVGPMLAQLVVLGAWGAAADRMGKKPVLILAGLGLVPVGLSWILVGPQHLWLCYLLLAAGAALWCGVEVANQNLVMEMAGKSRPGGGGAAYVATNSVIINVAGCFGGLAAGLIAQALKDWSWHPFASLKTFTSFDVLFVISGVLRLLSVALFLPFLVEPAAKPARATLRFMAAELIPARLPFPRPRNVETATPNPVSEDAGPTPNAAPDASYHQSAPPARRAA